MSYLRTYATRALKEAGRLKCGPCTRCLRIGRRMSVPVYGLMRHVLLKRQAAGITDVCACQSSHRHMSHVSAYLRTFEKRAPFKDILETCS
jgi:hypothetical protein